MIKKKNVFLPESHQITEFLHGQASKIFTDVAQNDKVVVVNKNSKPLSVVISYERFKQFIENGLSI